MSISKDHITKTQNSEKLANQFSERQHIQTILQLTKTYGLVLLTIELIIIVVATYHYMITAHPYFMNRIIPDFIHGFLSWLVAIILAAIFIMGPLVIGLIIVTTIVTVVCLIVSIYQLKRWQALQLPNQDYRLAIHSIIFNAISLTLATLLLSIILVALIL